MSVEAKKHNGGVWEYYIVESYNASHIGFTNSDFEDLNLQKFITQNKSDFIYYDIEKSLTGCLDYALLEKSKNVSNSINYYKPLDSSLNYSIRISLVSDTKYQYTKRVRNKDQIELHFFYPVKSCSEIPKSIFHGSSMAIHELGHVYFFSKNIFSNYTVPENEYWASKIAYCALINNPYIESVKVSPAILTEHEEKLIKSDDIKSGSKEASLGYKKLHSELYRLSKTDNISKDNPNMEAIKSWCTDIP